MFRKGSRVTHSRGSFQMSEGLPCKQWCDFLLALGVEDHRHGEQKSDRRKDGHLQKLCLLKIKGIYLWEGKFFILFKQSLRDYLPDVPPRSLLVENCVLCQLGGETPPHLNPQAYSGGSSTPVFFFISRSILCVGGFCTFSFPELSRNRSLSCGVLEDFWSFRTVVPNFLQWLKSSH